MADFLILKCKFLQANFTEKEYFFIGQTAAKNLIKLSFDDKTIIQATGLSKSKVEALRKEIEDRFTNLS